MRGMYATSDIKKDETIMFIPDHIILSLEKGIASPLGQLMANKNLLPGKNRLFKPNMDILTINNLQEVAKGTDSQYYYHFRAMPDSSNSFPV